MILTIQTRKKIKNKKAKPRKVLMFKRLKDKVKLIRKIRVTVQEIDRIVLKISRKMSKKIN